MRKTTTLILAIIIAVITVIITGGSLYMLRFSLDSAPLRGDRSHAMRVSAERLPDLQAWTDSVIDNHLLRDTFVIMPDGERHHAIYMRADSACGRTAVIVHGYKDECYTFLYLGRMYHRDLGYNILLPDLHGHGKSDGNDIQMGWRDRLDVMHWAEIASELFRDSLSRTDIVIHGVSMGAATTMCVSGEESLPDYITAFVEDCGYTSVWDEFRLQLKEQFSLPAFPLMHATSLLCKMRYGWSFGEASPLASVSRCHRPMLFIHGDSDTFVPFSMLKPLYNAKPQPKDIYIAKGSEHARAYLDNPKAYTDKVTAFLAEYGR